MKWSLIAHFQQVVALAHQSQLLSTSPYYQALTIYTSALMELKLALLSAVLRWDHLLLFLAVYHVSLHFIPYYKCNTHLNHLHYHSSNAGRKQHTDSPPFLPIPAHAWPPAWRHQHKPAYPTHLLWRWSSHASSCSNHPLNHYFLLGAPCSSSLFPSNTEKKQFHQPQPQQHQWCSLCLVHLISTQPCLP